MADEIIRVLAKDAPVKASAITAKDMVERARQIHRTLPVATAALGRALMACSMKSVFGDLLGLPTEERGTATLVATALTHAAGYRWHRVHNPLEARQSLCLAQALLRG